MLPRQIYAPLDGSNCLRGLPVTTTVKSATSEAVAKPAMPTESKTAEPATVVGRSIATPTVVGIPVAVGIRVGIVIVVVMMFNLGSWCSNKRQYTRHR